MFSISLPELPADVRILKGEADNDRGFFVLLLTSEEFDLVEEGDPIPFINPPTIKEILADAN